MTNICCDHIEHETPVVATQMVEIAWLAGGSNTHRLTCGEHAADLQCHAIGSGMYRSVTVQPLHFHVVGVKGVNPNNAWERRPDGLYEWIGSAYAFTDDQVEPCGEAHTWDARERKCPLCHVVNPQAEMDHEYPCLSAEEALSKRETEEDRYAWSRQDNA